MNKESKEMYTFNRPKQLYSSSLYIRVDKELLWSRSMSLGALRLLTLVLLNAAQFLFSVYFNLQLYLERTYDACSNQVKSVCEAEMRTWRLKTGKEEKKKLKIINAPKTHCLESPTSYPSTGNRASQLLLLWCQELCEVSGLHCATLWLKWETSMSQMTYL